MTAPSIRETALAWAKQDPNPVTAKYVQEASDDTLAQLFPPGKRIGFGTAGLRSAMKPGPLGMDDLVVIQTAQGLAQHVQSVHPQRPLIAVVGYDHRAHAEYQLSSYSFALMTALVFRQAGWECILLDGYVATLLVPFVVQLLIKLILMKNCNYNNRDGLTVNSCL